MFPTELTVNSHRIFQLNSKSYSDEAKGPVVYWMSRDQRVEDNWGLLYAQELALSHKKPLVVVFSLYTGHRHAYKSHYEFMLKGLRLVEKELEKKNILFIKLMGEAGGEVLNYCNESQAGSLVTDFTPLRTGTKWRRELSLDLKIPFYEVDSHNVVPCRYVSPKQEYSARTFRIKYHKVQEYFLTEYPKLKKHPYSFQKNSSNLRDKTWKEYEKKVEQLNYSNKHIILSSGAEKARIMLKNFTKNGLANYSKMKNDPNSETISNLSGYLHFGQISSQRVALEVKKSSVDQESKDVYLEELLIRKELSDNFCFYNANYDSIKGSPNWGLKTLYEHKNDTREYIYSLSELESAETHDDLWNASQMEMVKTGKMHGYLRMYWAKKILEWAESPDIAVDTAVYLNNKYELDGRDPSGYVGILWSMAGLHDRPWFERPIYGLIRYMSYDGAKKKFDIKAYIDKIENI